MFSTYKFLYICKRPITHSVFYDKTLLCFVHLKLELMTNSQILNATALDLEGDRQVPLYIFREQQRTTLPQLAQDLKMTTKVSQELSLGSIAEDEAQSLTCCVLPLHSCMCPPGLTRIQWSSLL